MVFFVSRARTSFASVTLGNDITANGTQVTPLSNMVSQEVFGKTETGEDVMKYTIQNSNGLELVVISWGATFVSLKCPDRYKGIELNSWLQRLHSGGSFT